ncbi:hypothetical protein O0L34_g18861 [Tuta absoluta]|nr:hypothetical protein O0L34_g18861 [Tuta absoluta]
MFSRIKYRAAQRILRRLYSSSTNLFLREQLKGAAYSPELVEKEVYKKWEKQGYFQPDLSSTKTPFSMVLPPPNVTGKLHLGHALGCTIQDVIVRRQRAMGYNVLWVPGTDHAGIATQSVVEKHLRSTKQVSKDYLGREKFNEAVWQWKTIYGNTITQQLRTLACSLDWSREIFTMDEQRSKAVNKAFKKLFTKGLIYRKEAMVNWCRALNSTVSDREVENVEINGPTDIKLPGYARPVKFGQMYNFAYKIFDTNCKEEIVVSTTTPETMLGDTAVAVHPGDPRYAHLAGKRLDHPFKNETIPIIFDDFVDMNFGTGAVKITPAHSKVDYDVATRHKLTRHQVIDETGTMIDAGKFTNMDRYHCRSKIIESLSDLGLLRDITPHKMTLPICGRTGDVIDYLPKEQWFISCKSMNSKAREAVEKGQLKILPEKFKQNWYNWTDDDRDWCISRQLWWGHQIPAYKCSTQNRVLWVSENTEKEAAEEAARILTVCPEEVTVERDQDVLDTWFSSGIYPFACLGWPEITEDYKKFYPLSLMATGHDILGLWVHRMVMLGLELTDQLPFDNILLHGVICDNKGAKMSKSRGNVIDPVDVIKGISMEDLREKSENMHKTGALSKEELKKALAYHKSNFSNTSGIPECGVDALRFTLLSQDVKSHFVNFDVSMCHANKLFCNKIWQSVKYTQGVCSRLPLCIDDISRSDLTLFDQWILSRLADMVGKVNQYLDNYDFHLATKCIRSHIYNEFCDTYLEATKPGFSDSNNIKVGYCHAHTLTAVLNTSLRCLSPFMVYLSESVIPTIPQFENNIIINYNDYDKRFFDFPQYKDFEVWSNPELEARVDNFLETARIVRELKGLCGMSSKLRPAICLKTTDDDLKTDLKSNMAVLLNLARSCSLSFENADDKKYIRSHLRPDSEICVEILGGDVQTALNVARDKLNAKISKLEKHLESLEKRFSTAQYLFTNAESTRITDVERIEAKKQELKQLQSDLQRLSDENNN